MPVVARALRSRNYRLYFTGQFISLAGTWMQQIAMIWLAYRLSSSAFVLGAIGFSSQIPSLIIAPFSGILIDRFDRRHLLMWTQSCSLLQALILTVLTWQDLISPGLLIMLAFMLGCINAVDFPARQSTAVLLVDDPKDLPNAIALNSFLMNLGRFIGPALAGFVVAVVGEAICFLINALSYLAVLLALAAIRISSQPEKTAPSLKAIAEGFRYVRGHRQILASLGLVASISFFAVPYTVMLPLFAREVFAGNARTYGLLVASAGAGAMLASLFLVSRKDTKRLNHWVSLAAPAAGISLALFAATSQLWQAFPLLVALGFSVILTLAGSNTLIQTRVDEVFRGRVMSIYAMSLLGVAPLGSLTVGTVAEGLGIRLTLALCGLITLLAGLISRSLNRS